MDTPNLRRAARECVSRARDLLARGDEPSARHACLELRFAIEYITYDQLQVYMKEVSDDALKKWTPKQVISELLEVDPYADQSCTIAFGLEHTYGISPPPEEMHLLGQDRRFSMKWANKNHNTLGNFLHAPTMHQIESGGAPTLADIIEKATDVANECEQILNSPVFHVNFGQFFNFECKDCSTPIRRRVGSLTPEEGVVCPKCCATYMTSNLSIKTRSVATSERRNTRANLVGRKIGWEPTEWWMVKYLNVRSVVKRQRSNRSL